MKPPPDAKPLCFGMINDVYLDKSVKGCTRAKRGEAGMHIKVNGVDQHMQQDDK